MDGIDCTALAHLWVHVKPQGVSDWHGDTNGVKQESCWERQISGCGDAAEVYVGSSSHPSALSFDLQWGTAFDVLIISLNRAQGGWGKQSRGEQRRGERPEGYGGMQQGKPKDVNPLWEKILEITWDHFFWITHSVITAESEPYIVLLLYLYCM